METRPGAPIFLFGAGQLFRSLLWCVTDLLIAFHFKTRIGLSGWATGEILFVSFAFGAVFDLLVATAIARVRRPLKSALRLQAVMGCAAAVAAALMFGPTPPGGQAALIYLVATSVAFRMAYGVFDVAQNALTSLLPQAEAEVRNYVMVRTTVSSVGRLAASGLVVFAMRQQAGRWADFSVVALTVVPIAISVVGLARLPNPKIDGPQPGGGMTWRALPYHHLSAPLAATLCNVGLLGLVGRLLPVLPNHDVSRDSSVLVAMVCGTVLGPFLLVPFRGQGRGPLSTAAGFSVIAAGSGCALLAPQPLAAALALATAYGAAQTAITNMIWERVARIIYEEGAESGIRIDVAAFALLTAFIKLSIAISNIFLGFVLDGLVVGTSLSALLVVGILSAGAIGATVALGLASRPGNRFPAPADVVVSNP